MRMRHDHQSWNYFGDAFVFGFSLAPSVLVAGPFHGLSMKHERASAEKVWLVLRRRCWSEILLGVVIGQGSMCVFPRFPIEINRKVVCLGCTNEARKFFI